MRPLLALAALALLCAVAHAEPVPVDMAAPVIHNDMSLPDAPAVRVAPVAALAWLKVGQPYSHAEIIVAALLGLLLLLEQILPRTKYVKANSTVELLANLLVRFFGSWGLVGKVLAVLATPQPPGSPEAPASGAAAASLRLLPLLVMAGLLSACAPGTDGARQALAAAERVSTQAVSSLEQYDLVQQQAIVDAAKQVCASSPDLAKCIEENAAKPVAAYRPKRLVVVKAITDESAVIAVGKALLPLVDSGVKKSTDVTAWLSQLLDEGVALASALHAFGVNIPGLAAVTGGK
jgi:hypothetical protein